MLLGPYLRFNNNVFISWVIIDVADGQSPQFYEKSLEDGAKYQAFQIEENEPIHAITPTTQKKSMWILSNKKYYEIIKGSLFNQYSLLEGKTIKPIRCSILNGLQDPQFQDIEAIPNEDQKSYYQRSTQDLEQELINAKEIEEKRPTKDYSLPALTKNMVLTDTQKLVLEKLNSLWFFNIIEQQYISEACQLILGQTIDNSVDVETKLNNDPKLLRENFCRSENIVKNFNDDVLISDVINFTYDLVNSVYQLHTNGDRLSRPQLPSCANQTVAKYKKTKSQEVSHHSHEDVNDRFFQEALFASFTHPHQKQNVLNRENEPQNIFQSEDSAGLRNAVRSQLYPPIELSLVARWCEWVCDMCRILDIYCLRMSNVGKEISKHEIMSDELKTKYNTTFFNSKGYFDDNIRNLYVAVLWKGRG